LFSCSALLYGAEIRLRPPHNIYSDGAYLRISCFTSRNLLDKELITYLENGIVLTFAYFVNLHKQNLFFDDQIAEHIIYKRVYYDIWNEMYYLETINDGKTIKKTYSNIDEITATLLEIKNVSICPIDAISPENKYYFKTRNTLKITQLYSIFHVVFNFLSIFKYKTTYLKSAVYSGSALIGK